MGTTYRFIADPSEPSEILAWFRTLPELPNEVAMERGFVLHFKDFGPLVHDAQGNVDSKASPVVALLLPRTKRGVLWTVGEVHFLATPLPQLYPGLHRVSTAFSRWLACHECIFSNQGSNNSYNYYLKGTVQNFDPPVFAFPSGLNAIKAGRYFVSDDDNDLMLETLCRMLRHRGVECEES